MAAVRCPPRLRRRRRRAAPCRSGRHRTRAARAMPRSSCGPARHGLVWQNAIHCRACSADPSARSPWSPIWPARQRKAPVRRLRAVEPDRNEQVFSPELDPSVDAVGGQGLGGGDAAGGAGQRRGDGCRLVGVQIDDRQVQHAVCVPARRDCARTTRRETASFELPRG